MTFQTQPTSFVAVTATLPIHKDHVGFILGKKCSTINGISLTTHTRITGWNQLTDSSSRNFIICGRSVQDVHRAYTEICLLANTVDAKTPRSQLLQPQQFSPIPHEGSESRIVVPQHTVGILLGAKGNTLHNITQHSGTWAKFYQADSKNDDKPTFSIRGFYQQDVQKTIQKMITIIESATTSSSTHSPPPLTLAHVAHYLQSPVRRANAEEPSSPTSSTSSTSSPTPNKRVAFKLKAG